MNVPFEKFRLIFDGGKIDTINLVMCLAQFHKFAKAINDRNIEKIYISCSDL